MCVLSIEKALIFKNVMERPGKLTEILKNTPWGFYLNKAFPNKDFKYQVSGLLIYW